RLARCRARALRAGGARVPPPPRRPPLPPPRRGRGIRRAARPRRRRGRRARCPRPGGHGDQPDERRGAPELRPLRRRRAAPALRAARGDERALLPSRGARTGRPGHPARLGGANAPRPAVHRRADGRRVHGGAAVVTRTRAVGRPWEDRAMDLGHVRLDSISVSAMDNNVYLLTARSGEQLLVDAADDAAAVLALLGDGGPLRTVVTTHGHWDHHRALAEVVAATGARTAAGAADAGDLPVPVDVLLEHGDRLTVDAAGEVALDVVALRGHTAGSVALAVTEGDGGDHPGRVHLL